MGYVVEWGGERVKRVAIENARNTLNDIGALGADLASGFSPVDTGALRDGWHATEATIAGHVIRGGFWNEMFYAGFVNDGTVKMAGHFMAQRALAVLAPDVPRRFQETLANGLH